jgi:hypothetical protein
MQILVFGRQQRISKKAQAMERRPFHQWVMLVGSELVKVWKRRSLMQIGSTSRKQVVLAASMCQTKIGSIGNPLVKVWIAKCWTEIM